jgi:quercetin dioxygenase-like cupin family protein
MSSINGHVVIFSRELDAAMVPPIALHRAREPAMYVTDNATAPRAALPGIENETLAGSRNGLRRLSVWRQTIAPGAATPPHRHDCEEVVIVESGRGALHVAGAVHAFGADTTLAIPANIDHQIINTGDEPIRLVAALSTSPVTVFLSDGTPLPLPWPT